MIESPQIWAPNGDVEPLLSPDGRLYVVALKQANLETNEVIIRFYVGAQDSVETARPRFAAELRTHAFGNLGVTVANRLEWTSDNRELVFVWEDQDSRRQVVRLDLSTGRYQYLTDHPTDVLEFDLAPDSNAVLYTAFPAPRQPVSTRSSIVEDAALRDVIGYSVVTGGLDGWNKWDHVELFYSRRTSADPIRIPTPSSPQFSPVEISPNGRFGIVALQVTTPPFSWSHYTNEVFSRIWLPAARAEPANSRIRQFHIVDLRNGDIKPLWDAPLRGSEEVRWSPDGSSLIIGPTFTPRTLNVAEGARGYGFAEVALEVRTARPLPIGSPFAESASLGQWEGSCINVRHQQEHARAYCKRSRAWRAVNREGILDSGSVRGPRLRMTVAQDINTPPTIVMVDQEAHTLKTVLEVAPQLSANFELGPAEIVRWVDQFSRSWTGVLYYPLSYQPGARVPLVIQTHGYSESAFSLTGNDVHPTVFAAQALAARDIAVLQMGDPDSPRTFELTQELDVYLEGFLSAVQNLSDRGIVDSALVGLSGFSRTGLHVEYALTHSDFPFAAALAADNYDAGYLQSLFWAYPETIVLYGSAPFGPGLEAWLENAPAFSADRIRTPLRLQINSGGSSYLLSQWELFVRLRRLHAPVELFVIPNVDAGTHNLQNPAQLLASAGGAVDWFAFWLRDYEDPDPSKWSQYLHWHQLRRERDTLAQLPRPPLLNWTSQGLSQ